QLAKLERRSRNRLKKGERGIWQRRFWEHAIWEEVDYQRHVDYMHYNPVKHGYVMAVVDWPFSSFHRFVRLGVYTSDSAGAGLQAMDSVGME
ncbi:MAG: transposase, partial [Methylococcales bacterium]